MAAHPTRGRGRGNNRGGGRGGGSGGAESPRAQLPRLSLEQLNEKDAVIQNMPEGAEYDILVYDLLIHHPWARTSDKVLTLEVDGVLWEVKIHDVAVAPFLFSKYVVGRLKEQGRKVPKEVRQPNDDMSYSCEIDEEMAGLSLLLRKYLTRGFTLFEFCVPGKPKESICIRGLSKFTGLTAADEDEASEAADKKHLFSEGGVSYKEAESIFITTKYNGENAKGTVRLVHGVWWVFAGSKNTCLACPLQENVRVVIPDDKPSVPAPRIMHQFHDFISSVAAAGQLENDLGPLLHRNDYVVLFEFLSKNYEHVFAFEETSFACFAIRGRGGMCISPIEAYRIFAEFRFPHDPPREVPGSQVNEEVERVRHETDKEGVVMYFVTNGKVTSLLKCKSDFYVIARATRQKFWRIVDTMKAAREEDGTSTGRVGVPQVVPDSLLKDVLKGIRARMRAMKQLVDYQSRSEEWSDQARAFVQGWVNRFNSETYEEQGASIIQAKTKFGTVYASFLSRYVREEYKEECARKIAEMIAIGKSAAEASREVYGGDGDDVEEGEDGDGGDAGEGAE